jgi:hypothetical protein
MHPALDIDLFATSAVPHAAETAVTEPSEPPSVAQVAAGQFGAAVSADAAASLSDHRFVLDETHFMEAVEAMPSFLRAPSPDYLDAVERGAA